MLCHCFIFTLQEISSTDLKIARFFFGGGFRFQNIKNLKACAKKVQGSVFENIRNAFF